MVLVPILVQIYRDVVIAAPGDFSAVSQLWPSVRLAPRTVKLVVVHEKASESEAEASKKQPSIRLPEAAILTSNELGQRAHLMSGDLYWRG